MGFFSWIFRLPARLGFFFDQLDHWLEARGIPGGSPIVLFAIIAIFLISIIWIREAQMRETKARTNYDSLIRLTGNEDGV